MVLIQIPGLLRFRAGEEATQRLIGRRLTHFARLQEGTAVTRPVFLRAGDSAADAEKILALRQPFDPAITSPQLLGAAEILRDALALQTELDKIPWFKLGSGVRIMRNEVTANLFRLVMAGHEFPLGQNQFLVEQMTTPKYWGKPVQSVPTEITLEFFERLIDLTGRRFRLPTDFEYETARLNRLGDVRDPKLTLLGDLWTLCSSRRVATAIVYRMTNGNTSPPLTSLEHCRGIRLAEHLTA